MLVVTSEFELLARALGQAQGCRDLPMVVVPHPFTTLPEDAVLELADRSHESIVAELVDRADSDPSRRDLLASHGAHR